MASTATRFDFHPPRPQGTGRAFSLAMLAHLALLGALTWGVSWKREATVSTVEAELWSSLPQQAAPKLQETAPPPTPQAEKAPEPPAPKTPDIAVEKEKSKPKIEPKPEAKPEPKPAPKVDKAAEERKLAQQREKERQEQLQRMAGLAGASGAPTAQGTALQSSGMASGWDARVKARVNPQINFSGDRSQLKDLELSITILPDGSLAARPKIIKSSGNSQWDEAVTRAFEKAESLPRDANGKLPPSTFRLTWIARE
jgi:colicin import membrane protein